MTVIADFPPVGSILDSDEFVLMQSGIEYKATRAEIVAAVDADLQAYKLANDADILALQTGTVQKTGSTLTGYLTAHADPINNLHMATKQYVDALGGSTLPAVGASLDATATAVTAAETNESDAIATTQYVADKIIYDVQKKTLVNGVHALLEEERGIVYPQSLVGTTTINLPEITSLIRNPFGTEYYIVDYQKNAEANPITINAFAGESIQGLSSIVLDTNGESVYLATDGVNWIIQDQVASASETKEGIVQRATQAEAEGLQDTIKYVTPKTLGDIVDARITSHAEIGTTPYSIVELDAGKKHYVTHTAVATTTVTLVDATTLVDPTRFMTEIWMVEQSGVNEVIINTAGGSLIDGQASITLTKKGAGCMIFADGTGNYVTTANTQDILDTVATAGSLDNVLTAGNTTGGTDIVVSNDDDIVLDDNGGGSGSSDIRWGSDHIMRYDDQGEAVLELISTNGVSAIVNDTWLNVTGASVSIRNAAGTYRPLQFSDTSGLTADIIPTTLTSNRTYTLQDGDGTLAFLSDIPAVAGVYLPLAGGTVTGDTIFNADVNIGHNEPGTVVTMRTTTEPYTLQVDTERTSGTAAAARFQSVNVNANDNIALKLQATNGANNYALDITNGILRTDGDISMLNGTVLSNPNGGQINLRDAVDATVSITTDNGLFATPWHVINQTYNYMSGNGTGDASIVAHADTTDIPHVAILVKENIVNAAQTNVSAKIPTIISSASANIAAGVVNSVVLGGTNVTATANDTVYTGGDIRSGGHISLEATQSLYLNGYGGTTNIVSNGNHMDLNTPLGRNIRHYIDSNLVAQFTDLQLELADDIDISVGATNGTKIATSAVQLLGFWGATPKPQPTTAIVGATLVGGGGVGLTDSDTYDGYTIQQVVAALRQAGILA
jgi:hypothetical protein